MNILNGKPTMLVASISAILFSTPTLAAQSVPLNQSIIDSIHHAGTTKSYRVVINTPQVVDFYTTGDMDSYGTVYDSNHNVIASDDDGGQERNFRIQRRLDAGVYFVHVRHFSASGTGQYTFVTRGSATNNHGSNQYSATRISLNSSQNGYISRGGEVNYYRVHLPSNQTLNIATTGSTDTYGILLDSAGNQIESNDDGGQGSNFSISRRLQAGDYYIAVRHYDQNNGTGSYHLTVNGSGSSSGGSSSQLSDDHGNNRYSATSISLNSSRNGRINRGGDVDYFRFRVNGSQSVSLSTSGDIDTYGTLFDSSGRVIATDDDAGQGGNFSITRSLNSGDYYIEVKHYNQQGTGDYILSVNSQRRQLSAPTLTSPSNGAFGLNRATYRWNAVSGAEGYRIVISQDSNFSGFNESRGTCSNCYTTITSGTTYTSNSFNLARHQYYWKVGTVVGGNVVAWSDVRSFVSGNTSLSHKVDTFVQTYTGVPVDPLRLRGHGVAKQCTDLWYQYARDVLGVEPTHSNGFRNNAYYIFSNFPEGTTTYGNIRLTKIHNDTTNLDLVPQKGDIVFWAPHSSNGNAGHVAIFLSETEHGRKFNSFDQNWPRGSYPRIVNHNYTGPRVVGWLRPTL